MKKLLPAILLAFVLHGCSKSNQPEENKPAQETDKHKVSFTVEGFAANTTVMSTPGAKATTAVGDTLKNYADNLYYRIYDSNGNYVNGTEQTSTSPGFGVIADQLASGTYSVFMAASKGALRTSDKTVTYGRADFGPTSSGAIWNDTFIKNFTLTVGTADLSQAVRLERTVAAYQVILEDAIPAEATKISLSILYDSPTLPLAANNISIPLSPPIQYALTAADKGVKNKSFSGFLSNTFVPVSIVIKAYNSSNAVIAEKSIKDLKFEKNKRTTLTGPLFPPPNPSGDFTVVVNPVWTPGTTIKF
jgi:uncharacterized protein YcfL